MRRLIINADDFGLTGGVNRAIIECHRAGSVTSTTLMANSAEFANAVDLARAYPGLGVGCHVMLVDGKPLLSPEQVSSLLDPRTQEFRNSAADFARAAVRKQLRPEDIAAEAHAQMRKLLDAGVRLTHFDTHKHTHIFPTALKALLGVAKDLDVRAVRNPFGSLDVATSIALAQKPRLWLRHLQMKVLSRYSVDFARAVKDSGLRTTDGTFGILSTGSFDERAFRTILDAIPEGTWELVCHPGYNDSALANVKTRLRESRIIEREVLTMPQVRDEIRARGIELISFAQL